PAASLLLSFFFSPPRRPPSSTLFPYTTLFRSQRKFAAARSALETAVRLKPELPEAHNDLGIVQAEEGNFATAVESYRRAIALRRSEEHTSELQSPDHLVCRLLLEKKNNKKKKI